MKWGDVIPVAAAAILLMAMVWLMKVTGWSVWGHW